MVKEKKLIDFVNHNQFELQSYLSYLLGNEKRLTESKKIGAIIIAG